MTDVQSNQEIELQLQAEITSHALRRLGTAAQVPRDVIDDVMIQRNISFADAILYIALDDVVDDPSGLPDAHIGHGGFIEARVHAEMGRIAPLVFG
jgi:hypothetical protein